jgi:pimeloyl-ACP methyl ester carboxylesterase
MDGQATATRGSCATAGARPSLRRAASNARLVEIADSYTLIMRDQPEAFARAVREFVRETNSSVSESV